MKKGILPLSYWLVLAGLAIASVVLGLARIHQHPLLGLSRQEAHALVSGQQIDPGFSQWICGYSGGLHSVKDPIRIEFTEDVDSARQAKALEAGLLEINPQVKGKLVWENAHTLAYRPDTLLDYNRLYAVKLKLGEVYEVQTEKFQTFNFGFETQHLGARMQNLSFGTDGALRTTLVTSDYVPRNAVEGGMTASGLPGKAAWTHSPDGKRHTAQWPDPRGSMAQKAGIAFDLQVGHSRAKAVRKFTLPKKGAFQYFGYDEVTEGEHSLIVHFTYPVGQDQSLAGLLTLDNQNHEEAVAEGCDARLSLPYDMYGKQTLKIAKGILDHKKHFLHAAQEIEIELQPALPGLKLASDGFIVPETGDQAYLAFDARGLRQATVKLYRVFPTNVPEFLARVDMNDKSAGFYQRTLGRPVGVVTVDLPEQADASSYSRYRVDISRYMAEAPGGLHFASVSFNPDQMRIPCPGLEAAGVGMSKVPDRHSRPESGFDSEGEDYYDESNGWDRLPYRDYEGEDEYYEEGEEGESTKRSQAPMPCYGNYRYIDAPGLEGGKVSLGTYLLRSNLALQARVGQDGQVHLITTDLRTAEPVADVQVEVLGKQHQVLGQGKTNRDGIAKFDLKSIPAPLLALAHAKQGEAFLSLTNAQALDYTAFANQLQGGQATSGEALKGFVYTERGTYRPGDSLHVAFILQGADQTPLDGPVVLEVTNPRGTQIYKRSRTETLGHHYRWNVPTEVTAPTGGYSLLVRAGDQTFYKDVSVETIRPNRMQIDFKLNKPTYLEKDAGSVDLTARYLYGTPAAGLKVTVRSKASMTSFSPAGFDDYQFRDYLVPEPNLADKPGLILDGKTDAQGKATLPFTVPEFGQAQAPVRLTLTTQVFEQGGQFSQQFSSMTVHPCANYLGIKEAARPDMGSYGLNQKVKLDIVQVDALSGKPVSGSASLLYSVRRLDWVWWYEDVRGQYIYDGAGSGQYVENSHVDISGGKGTLELKLAKWGRYAVQVLDPVTKHSTSQILYVGMPDYEEKKGGDPMQRVVLKSNKQVYAPGETATLYLPKAQVRNGDKVLVSLEAGNQSLTHTWTQVDYSSIKVMLPKEAMPNCFAHLTVIRPFEKTQPGRPIRAYGLIALEVHGSESVLEPQLVAPLESKPSLPITAEVSEKHGQGMTYVLAMVDEGLLNLTNFKTPDPSTVLNGRRGLAVRSFDMFGLVVDRGYLASAQLAAGGDAFLKAEAMKDEARNKLAVEAVSYVRGPFTLKPGEKAKHTLPAPSYPGAVRWMLIANTEKVAASTEALSRIKADMILEASLPRVASCGDEIRLPIEVESFMKGAATATISATVVSGPGALVGKTSAQVPVALNGGRKMAPLTLKAGKTSGMVVLKLVAKAGGTTVERTVRLPIRYPNRFEKKVQDLVVQAGEAIAWPAAVAGSLQGPMRMEVSTAPPLGLTDKLDYLIHYPYGCAEQTTSSGVGQLYLPLLVDLNDHARQDINRNVAATIDRLQGFELGNGLLSLWMGGGEPELGASAYACWFMQEAERLGHGRPAQLARLEKGLNRYMKSASAPQRQGERDLFAYMYYCMGPAAEDASLNRLAQDPDLSQQGHILLAGAYLRRGNLAQAKAQLAIQAKPSNSWYIIYGSPLRDMAIEANVEQMVLNQSPGAVKQVAPAVLKLAEEVRQRGNYYFWSTQELGMAFSVLANLPESADNATITVDGKQRKVGTRPVPFDVKVGQKAPVLVNASKGALYIHSTLTYAPPGGKEPEEETGLQVSIKYVDELNRPMDPTRVKQGQTFQTVITVTNSTYQDLDNLALSQAVPGGWEIENQRLASETAGNGEALQNGLSHEDIRDDRINRFFSLASHKSISFRTRLTAAYAGTFSLPALVAEAMYQPQYRAVKKGAMVRVE